VATGWTVDRFPAGSDRLWGPPRILFNGYRGMKTDQLPIFSAEVKNAWSYTSIPHTSSLCDA